MRHDKVCLACLAAIKQSKRKDTEWLDVVQDGKMMQINSKLEVREMPKKPRKKKKGRGY